MALRRHLLIALAMLDVAFARAAIRAYPLDERCVYTIAVGRDAPTTCVFPGALSALEGAGIGQKPEESPPVLLSFQAGAEFFSVRALKENATAALNVVYRQKVYVLCFIASGDPDRAVTFLPESLVGGPGKQPSSDVLRALLERAKQHERLTAQYPALLPAIPHAEPNHPTLYPRFTAVIEQVFRFDPEDALAFRIRLENPGDTSVVYDRASLAVRVRGEIFPAALVEASGAIPPHSITGLVLVICGTPEGGRANLSVRDNFSVIVPSTP